MSSNLIRIIAVFFVMLAIILAIIGFRMSQRYAQNARRAAEQSHVDTSAGQQKIVVSVKHLDAFQPITADSVKLAPVQTAPEKHFDKLEDVVGRAPMVEIDAGSPITSAMFERSTLAKLVPPGHKALSLSLTDLIGVGGFLEPRDIVDILIYLHTDRSNGIEGSQARVLLRDVLVLGVDGRTNPTGGGLIGTALGLNNPGAQSRRDRTVVLAVPDEWVNRVMLGASLGELRLALHPEKERENQPAGQSETVSAPASIAEALAYDSPFIAAQLGQLKPPPPPPEAGRPGIMVYRGSAESTVYP